MLLVFDTGGQRVFRHLNSADGRVLARRTDWNQNESVDQA
jgi:hypothetical protein